jgi:uncharacterized protein (DUF433 family)
VHLGLFTAEQTCRLAQISIEQLRYWDKTKVFRPSQSPRNGAFHRLYTFRDVVGLRLVSVLQNQYRANLEDLRDIAKRLKSVPDKNWSNLIFQIEGDGKVHFHAHSSASNGQGSLLPIREMISGIEKRLAQMNRRTKEQVGKVQRSRYVMRNAPVIAGTRILTESIYDLHQAGFSTARIIKEYPRLKAADVNAAIRFEKVRLAG